MDKEAAEPYNITGLYDAIKTAETGPYKNKWIRTLHAPKGGSTAYGPVQMTGTLVKDYMNRFPDRLAYHRGYARRFLDQASKFSRFGKNKTAPGYSPAYDYGGTGDLHSTEYRDRYRRLALAIMKLKLERNKGDVARTVRDWRGAPDPNYVKTVMDNYNKQRQQR